MVLYIAGMKSINFIVFLSSNMLILSKGSEIDNEIPVTTLCDRTRFISGFIITVTFRQTYRLSLSLYVPP